MGQQTTERTCRTTYNKTYQEQLRPTPTHERALEHVVWRFWRLWRCRTLYNAALEQRITAWHRCHSAASASRALSRKPS
jgi:hypothetical protein